MVAGQPVRSVQEETLRALVDEVRTLAPELAVMRRDFHKLAELGWHEQKTTTRIVEELQDLGYQVIAGRAFLGDAPRLGLSETEHKLGVGDSGCIAVFETGRPGPTVAVRIDIDALPITEATADHRPASGGWSSDTPGTMHACGHDGHIAIGLAVARLMKDRLEHCDGRLKLIFQPAEEGVRGAKSVVEAGWLDDVDLLLGFHIGLGVPSGTIALGLRGFLATQKYRVTFTGQAAHAGQEPQNGRNALLPACQTSIALHTLAQSSKPGIRVNVGTLKAGTALNIVPDQAVLEVEFRAEQEVDLKRLVERAHHAVEGIAKAHEVDCSLTLIGEATDWSNTEDMATWVRDLCVAGKIFQKHLMLHEFGASEDVTLMCRQVSERGGSAAYFVLGSDLTAGHHTPGFDFDEGVLVDGTAVLTTAVLSSLSGR